MDCFCFTTVAFLSLAVAFLAVIFSFKTRKSADVKGKHVMITGGSSGIGKCCAVELAKRGANITLIARDKNKLEDAKGEIQAVFSDKKNQKVNIVSLDVSQDYDKVEKTLIEAVEKMGPVFILLNCAGFAIASRMEDTSPDDMMRLLNVNFVGSYYVTKALVPLMKSQKEGHIVFTSSQAGLLGVYGYTAYSAAKFALRGLAETLQMETRPFNIKVTLAFPPDTDTPGFAEEEKTKPEETRLISETSTIVSPEVVAKSMIQDVLLGKFFSSVGFDGNVISTLCAGFSPVTSAVELVIQVFTMGILRIVASLLLNRFDGIVKKCYEKKATEKDKKIN